MNVFIAIHLMVSVIPLCTEVVAQLTDIAITIPRMEQFHSIHYLVGVCVASIQLWASHLEMNLL